jgi:cellulose synthase/poly-beta-1,6-N-acetylglucosamine synthase-like glycosyltransferase
MIEALVVACLLLLAYSYVGYPGLLWLLRTVTPARPSRAGEPTQWPSVSIIVSAYNEEQVIAERMRNLLAIDYPRDRLEILVGSDGSTDRTCAIVQEYEPHGVRLIAFGQRGGKASVLNNLVARARGKIVVLTDANTFFHPDAVRALVTALWRHPTACAVVGHLELRSPTAAGNLDGAYWRYETWLKTLESRFGAVLGANGAIYAFRRARYRPLPGEAVVDDFLIPMLMRLYDGGEVFFVPAAQAYETSPTNVRHELRRRVRIGAGDLQALLWTWPLLLPWKGMVAFSYLSHKVLRWLGPWLMLTAFTANLALLGRPVFREFFLVQLAFYGLGALAAVVRPVPLLGPAASAVLYFILLNAGLGLGFVRLALGLQRPFWSTVPRSGGPIRERTSTSPPEPRTAGLAGSSSSSAGFAGATDPGGGLGGGRRGPLR